jgi:hypothetical protein
VQCFNIKKDKENQNYSHKFVQKDQVDINHKTEKYILKTLKFLGEGEIFGIRDWRK